MNKDKHVKAFFEQVEIYFHYDYNIQLRTEIVKDFIGEKSFENVLDMPCGNGWISLANAQQFNRLTLVDFSENMIKLTKANINQLKLKNATVYCEDIFKTNFPKNSFDLVISLGIFAHISDIPKYINEIISLVAPGGYLIVQNTDSAHFYGKLINLYLGLKTFFGKQKYCLNKVHTKEVLNRFKDKGFELEKSFRYNQSFLGFSKLFSNEKKYQLTKKWFGTPAHPKNQHLGSDGLFLLRKI